MEHQSGRDADLAWTGERLIAGVHGDVALEHLHRYAVARELARDKTVLDIASGEGYGSSLLAGVARSVIGVDIDPQAVGHARRHYARKDLEFRVGSATEIPVESSSVELVVSFETLEHLDNQDRMLAEIRRVLVPGGVLVISTPDRRTYTELPDYHNPYHVRELDRAEFAELIGRHFRSCLMLGERVCHGSLLAPIAGAYDGAVPFSSFAGDYQAIDVEAGLRAPVYLIAVATDGDLPRPRVPSLFEARGIRTNVDLVLEGRDRLILEAHQEIARSRVALEQTRGELDHAKAVLGYTRDALDATRDAMAEYARRLQLAEEEIAGSEAALARLSNSRSVRVTTPLRALAHWARGVKARGRTMLGSVVREPHRRAAGAMVEAERPRSGR